MKQIVIKHTIKAGELLKYHRESHDLNGLGFVLGHVYMVSASVWKGKRFLDVTSSKGSPVAVSDVRGTLTDAADYFTKHICPIVLPQKTQSHVMDSKASNVRKGQVIK